MNLISIVCLAIIALSGFPPSPVNASQWIALGQQQEVSAPEISVRTCTFDAAVIDVHIPGFLAQSIDDHGAFTKLSLPDHGTTTKKGEPELPVVRFLLELPQSASVELTWESGPETEVRLSALNLPATVYPFQPSAPKIPGSLANRPFAMDQAIYQQSGYISSQCVTLTEIGILRGRRIAQLEVAPFAYAPDSGALKVSSDFLLTVSYDGADELLTLDQHARYDSEPFAAMASALICNPNAYTLTFRAPPQLPIGYLVITADALAAELEPLLAWKRMKGYDATLVLKSQIPGGTATAIKSYIQTAYETWETPPTFVLLVGDVSGIPSFTGSETSSVDDTAYAAVDGTDYIPDLGIGRFPAADASQAAIMVAKTLQYETGDWESSSWLTGALFMASTDNYSITEGTHNFVVDTYMNPHGFDSLKIYSRLGGTAQQVSNAINGGRGLVIYSGHGSETQWADGPPYYQSHVRALTNGEMTPWVSSHACLTGDFALAECFAETWLRVANKGSLSFWSASTYSYWDEDDVLEKGMFETLFVDEVWTLGYMTNAALQKLYDHYGGAGRTKYYFQEYNLLGDPSVALRTAQPAQIAVQHPQVIPVGSFPVAVTVTALGAPVPNALVCLTKLDEVHATAYTNQAGQVTLTVTPTTPGEMSIVVTGQNIETYQSEFMVLVTGCGVVLMGSEQYSCSSNLEAKLWDADLNVNPAAPDSATVMVSSDSEPTPELLTMVETGNATNEFTGGIALAPENAPGVLWVNHGDTITLLYHDADCSGSPADVTATATVDCAGPAITNIFVIGLSNTSATITWVTDEVSDSIVEYGIAPDSLNRVAMDSNPTTNHRLLINGLTENTFYYFCVSSRDSLGNVTREDNGGRCYRFKTKLQVTVFADNFEFALGWTETGDGSWEWDRPRGLGGTLITAPDPSHDHTSGNGYVIGVDLTVDGNYNTLTNCSIVSPSFNCSGITGVTLSFYRWLNCNVFTDKSIISVSGDGGATWTEVWSVEGLLNDRSWIYAEYSIASVADGRPNVKIKFTQTADLMLEASGWNIDDLLVFGFSSSATEPTPTWGPTYPPTPSPTPTTAASATSTPSPTSTLVPDTPTAPATSTPSTSQLWIDIATNLATYRTGDRFLLTTRIVNSGESLPADLFIILDVFGNYWCYPSWCMVPQLDSERISIGAGQDQTSTILDFLWPYGAGSADGLLFWAALLDPASSDLLCQLDVVEFAFE